jgi:polysaccharide biosynthesis transport protein
METASHLSSENRLHFLDYWRIIRVRKLVIMAVFLLVVTTTTVVTLWLPKTYASKASILVQKDRRDAPGITDIEQQLPFDYNFMQTQFQLIQSRLILDQVITELALHERWAKRYGRPAPYSVSDAYDLLLNRLDLRPIRNTSYIDIKAFSEVPEEAADIANKVAETYKKHREQRFQQNTDKGLDTFQKELANQELVVSNLTAKVNRLREELGISDAFANNDSYVSLLESETVRQKQAQQTEALTQFLIASNKLYRVEGKTPQELRYVLPTVHPDNVLSVVLIDLARAEQALTSKRQDYTDDHPEVVRAKAEFDTVSRQVDENVTGIVKGLRDQRDAARDTFQGLKKEFEETRQMDIQMATKSAPYYVAKQELKQQRDTLVAVERKVKLESMNAKIPVTHSMVEITDPAVPAIKPYSPKIPLNIAAAIVVGLIAGIGLAFFIEYLDTSVKTIDDIEQVLGTQVLSVIPQGVTTLIEEGPESPNAEAYRVLRTNILFGRKNDGQNVITAVSGGAAEGKSTTLLNLAIILAQNGSRVLLVDTDLRRPSLHKALNTGNTPGLTSYLLKQNTLEEVIQTTPVNGLDFLPSGRLPSSSLGILNSPHFHEFVQEMKRRFDFVLLDSPPVLGVSDASFLIREADITLLVLQHRKYPQAMNVRAKQTIEKFGGNLLGVVLNNINLSTDSYYYYYSGYGYGYTNQNQDGEEKQPAKTNGTNQPAAEGDKVSLKRKY